MHQLRLFLIALQFLTRVPVPARIGWSPEWLSDSARYFPAVGAVVGAFGACVLGVASLLWPWPVAVGLSMLATIVLTGAFHEDGLADTCDALGGAVDRERALAIMKDSRLGTYGVVGLVALLGLKFASLTQMALPVASAALVVGHAASRAVAVTLIRWLPYAGDPEASKAKPLARAAALRGWWVAWLWPLVAAAIWPELAAAWSVAFIAAAIAGLLCAGWFMRRLGGITGDCLGAAQQIAELVFYLAILARWREVVM